MKKRDKNIEVLRAIACLAVVLLHLNAWLFQIENLNTKMKILNVSINTVVRFAVPCFMLITGTFVFENISKKVSWKEFYKKVINSIIIPTLLYSVMYVIYLELKNCIDGKKVFINHLIFGQREFLLDICGICIC